MTGTTQLLRSDALIVVFDAALRSIAILFVAWFATRAWRRTSAATRHLIWLVGVTLSVVLPLGRIGLPAWQVSLPRASAVASIMPMSTRVPATRRSPLPATMQSNLPDVPADQPHELINERSGLSPARLTGSTSRATRSPKTTTTLSAPTIVLGIWIIGMALVLFPWAAGVVSRRRLYARAMPLSPQWERAVADVRAERPLLDRIEVRESSQAKVPMTWGILRPRIIVPESTDWSPSFRRAALLHEIAHIERRDVLGFAMTRVACAMYWFNPFIWIAARAVRAESELACDDRVLEAGTRPSEYARQLMDVAGTMGYFPAGALAMARPATLPVRLRALLDASRNRSVARPAVAASLTILGLLVAAPVAAFTPISNAVSPAPSSKGRGIVPSARRTVVVTASPSAPMSADIPSAELSTATLSSPGLPAATLSAAGIPLASAAAPLLGDTQQQGVTSRYPCLEPPRSGSTSSMNSVNDNGRERTWRVRWTSASCRFEFEAKGIVEFNDDATDVRSISSGGWLELEVADGRTSRRIRLEPDRNGLSREYWLDGRRAEYDRDASDWFETALVALDRRTAFAVEQRLPKLLRRGVPATLDEIASMPYDYAKRIYYTKLFAVQPLTTAQVRDVLTDVGRNLSSDYEKAELLLAISKLEGFESAAHLEFAHAAGTIKSDYERRRALTALLAQNALSPNVVRAMLEAAQGMSSDYELAELLVGIAKQYGTSDATREYYMSAIKSIRSDYERRRVLNAAIMSDRQLPADVVNDLLVAASAMSSDYERAEFLIAVVDRASLLDNADATPFFKAADGLKSDYEHHRVLSAALKKGKASRNMVEGILRSARSLDSDYECASLLVEVASTVTIDDRLRPVYEDAANTLKSEYEYGRAMGAIRRRTP